MLLLSSKIKSIRIIFTPLDFKPSMEKSVQLTTKAVIQEKGIELEAMHGVPQKTVGSKEWDIRRINHSCFA